MTSSHPVLKSSELHDLQHKIHSVTNESLESTRRMRQLAEGSKEFAIRTMVELDDHGEKLDSIETGLVNVNKDMEQAKQHLKGLGVLDGLIPKFLKRRGSKEDVGAWRGNDDGKIGEEHAQRVPTATVHASGGYISKITNDSQEEEMDSNLEEVSSIVGNLRHMALDISLEVDTQTRQIDRIQRMAEKNNDDVDDVNRKTTRLLKRI